jgi:predicted DCC family thiol-disulfide oxidoreductase YuxK
VVSLVPDSEARGGRVSLTGWRPQVQRHFRPMRGTPPRRLASRTPRASLSPMSTTRILYNDACPICRAEIAHYRARAAASGAPLAFEDLNGADLGGWRLTPDQAMRRMHARLPDGRVVSGVEAFARIWEALPGYRWLARLVRVPGVRHLGDLAYNRIAAPWLYRRHLRRMALAGEGPRP